MSKIKWHITTWLLLLGGGCSLAYAVRLITLAPDKQLLPTIALAGHLLLFLGSLLAVRHFALRHILVATLILTGVFTAAVPPCGDVARYAWEGLVQTHGINPYVTPPEAVDRTTAPYFDDINHKDKTAIYPPLAQLYFHGLASLFGTGNTPFLHNLSATLAFLLVAGLLTIICRRQQRRPEWVAIFTLSPVALTAFPGEGHLDIYMLLALCLALIAWQSKRFVGWVTMFATLALAAQLKYVAVFVWPFFVNRENWKLIPLLLIFAFAPFLLYAHEGSIAPIFETLATFSYAFQYNASLHALLTGVGMSLEFASTLLMLALLVGIGVIRLFNNHPLEGSVYALGWLLLCAGTVHPWYLSWPLLFLVFRPSTGWLLVTGSIGVTWFTIAHFHATDRWYELPGIAWIVWLPLLAGLLIRQKRKTLADAAERPTLHSITIIIPTKNEESHLPALLASIAGQKVSPTPQILVADADSTDATQSLAESAGATVIYAPPGRGKQIAEATPYANGDLILVLHADANLQAGTLTQLLQEANQSRLPGGAIGATFHPPSPFLRGIEFLNKIRARYGGISFGDQGQWIRRDALPEVGGWPAIPLMEDVEISLRLKELETPGYLGSGLEASSRAWKDGAAKNPKTHKRARLIIALVASYLFLRFFFPKRLKPDDFAKRYYS